MTHHNEPPKNAHPQTNYDLYERLLGQVFAIVSDVEVQQDPGAKETAEVPLLDPWYYGEKTSALGDTRVWRRKDSIGQEVVASVKLEAPGIQASVKGYSDALISESSVTYEVTEASLADKATVTSTLHVKATDWSGEIRPEEFTGDFAGLDQLTALEQALRGVVRLAAIVNSQEHSANL